MNPRYIVPCLTFLIFFLAGPLTQPSPAHSITDLTELIKQNPVDASAYFNRGRTYGQRGDYDRAIKDFDRVIKLDPQNRRAHDLRDKAQRELERLNESS